MDFNPKSLIPQPLVRCVGRPKKLLDRESRSRRDVANNHERKRMQSINDGIQALRRILRHKDIEKLSKATVLLRSAEYVIHLESELSLLADENYRLKCLVKQLFHKNVFGGTGMPFPHLFYSQKSMSESTEKLIPNDYNSDESEMDDNNGVDNIAMDLTKCSKK
ncbi:unnamed protein product [Oppiella nova]|uniref:BHLH domain-containing protein n=1 Tax=Oppiella nova TaxID=334625 RepID=A0A7R9MEG0_9ACAR|nr:unnamed protein product [Oppiella nova]CAG2175553.1 unnamed protein product [Oppiella nova]